MKVLATAKMVDGTDIQIEEWKENYHFLNHASTIASYPISKHTFNGSWSPKEGQKCRIDFTFNSEEETKQAFEELKNGSKTLADFSKFMGKIEYLKAIQ